MAGHYHLNVKIIGKKNYKSIFKRVAYCRRESFIYQDKEYKTHKDGCVHSAILLPEKAPKAWLDPQVLWEAVEAVCPRRDAQLAREMNVGLPKSMTLEQQVELLDAYIKEAICELDCVADYSIHYDKEHNPHAHILFTMQTLRPNGFGGKNRDLNDRKYIKHWRELWAEHVNNKVDELNLGEHEYVDHLSFRKRGLIRLAKLHLGEKTNSAQQAGRFMPRARINRLLDVFNLSNPSEEMLKKVKGKIKEIKSLDDEEAIKAKLTELDNLINRRKLSSGGLFGQSGRAMFAKAQKPESEPVPESSDSPSVA